MKASFRAIFLPITFVFILPVIPTHGSRAIAESGAIVVPLKADGFSYIVEAVINDGVTANLIIDTGAGFTVVSQKLAIKLGYRNINKAPGFPVTTATGVEWTRLVTLKKISVGKTSVANVEAVISSNLPDGMEGLLGMSFLSEFSYKIDGPGKKLTLKPLYNAGELFGAKNKEWWKKKQHYYVMSLRKFRAYSEKLSRGAPPDNGRASNDGNVFKLKDLKAIEEHYRRLLKAHELAAASFGAPLSRD